MSHSQTTFFKFGSKTLGLKVLFFSAAFADTLSDQKLDSSEVLERDYFLIKCVRDPLRS